MRSLRKVALVLLLGAVGAGCGASGMSRRPPPQTSVDSLRMSARKVDNAVVATKRMIERSRGAAYLPEMFMRLAELYTERARYAWLIVYETRRQKGDTARAFDVPESRLLKNLAIGIYERLLKEFPKYEHADRAQFLLAHEMRELGEFDKMRAAYDKLVATYPQSPHRNEAYLILGDTEFDRGDLTKAETYYSQVLAQPESPVHPLARYKLAWVRVNREDCPGAVRLFEKVLDNPATPHDEAMLVATQKSLNLRRESLIDLAYCYPEVLKDAPAAPYFRKYADSSSDYMAAMRRVANRFTVKQMYVAAAGALREVLSAAATGDEALESARKLYDNVLQGKDFTNAATDVELIGRVYEAMNANFQLDIAKRERLGNELEVYARDIATKSNLAAKAAKGKDKDVRGRLAATALAYDAYLKYFKTAKERPGIERNRAEVLMAAGQGYRAAAAFEALAQTATDTRKDDLNNAISLYQQALDARSLARVERHAAWAGIRAAGRQFVAAYPNDALVVPIKFSIARSYYEAGDYRRAVDLFDALAHQYPTAAEAVASGHLALDSLLLVEDFQGLAALGRRLVADASLGDETFKGQVRDIVAKAEQRQITELTITAGSQRDEQLLALARRNKGSGLGEQALYNALVLARDSDVGRFYELGEQFLEEYPRSSHRTDVLGALATVATDRADYQIAAGYLEAAYAAAPSAKDALDRMAAAASIRAFLGDPKAGADLKELIGRGAGNADGLLLVMARAGNFAAIEDVLGSTKPQTTTALFLAGYLARKRGDIGEAQALLARAAGARGDSDDAREAVAKARFLLGELVYDTYGAYSQGGDLAKSIADKSQLLAQVDKAYASAIQSGDATWALAAVARVSQAYAGYAEFLRGITLPAGISEDEQKQVRAALEAKAGQAVARAAELRKNCAKRASDSVVFSEVVKGCLTEEPLPARPALFPEVGGRTGGEPTGAAALRTILQKTPRSVPTLVKLARLYLAQGDTAMSLLILNSADQTGAAAQNAELLNLRGVALVRAGDPDAAYDLFKKAATLDPSQIRYRANLAAHLLAYGHTQLAAAELKKIGKAPTPQGDVTEHPELAGLARLEGPAPAPKKGGK